MSSKNRREEAVFHLNIRLNNPLNFKENRTLKYAFSLKIHPFSSKIPLGRGTYILGRQVMVML